jgi:hypothetical protein
VLQGRARRLLGLLSRKEESGNRKRRRRRRRGRQRDLAAPVSFLVEVESEPRFLK